MTNQIPMQALSAHEIGMVSGGCKPCPPKPKKCAPPKPKCKPCPPRWYCR